MKLIILTVILDEKIQIIFWCKLRNMKFLSSRHILSLKLLDAILFFPKLISLGKLIRFRSWKFVVYSNFHPSPDIVFLQFFHWINIKVKFPYMDSLKGLEISLLIVHYRKNQLYLNCLVVKYQLLRKRFLKIFSSSSFLKHKPIVQVHS